MESANKLQCKCLSIDSYCFSEEFVKLFSAFYVSLDELLVREGAPKKIPECKRIILVVDIDQWEIEQARRQHRCLNSTMDFVALLSNKKMLLVDAKFRVETNELNSSFIIQSLCFIFICLFMRRSFYCFKPRRQSNAEIE